MNRKYSFQNTSSYETGQKLKQVAFTAMGRNFSGNI